jgi:hypothetical protein
MKATFKDPDFVLMCALDYVVGRSTYAPSMIAREIEYVWADLKPETRKYIRRIIGETRHKDLIHILEL